MAPKHWPLALALVTGLLACGGSGEASKGSLGYGASAEQAYLAALEGFRAGECMEVESEFRRIRREFPYSRFAALAELRIADCLLQQKKHAEAIQAYRQFTRFRPSHELVPYARFKIAEAHFKQIPDDWLLAPPAHERDQAPTRRALQQIRRFLLDFPDDPRVGEAREMMSEALELLAQHELYVAEFYLDRDAPHAAVARLRSLVNSYQGSELEPKAWLVLGKTYLDMNVEPEARRAFEAIVERFPKSEQAAEARAALRKLGAAATTSER